VSLVLPELFVLVHPKRWTRHPPPLEFGKGIRIQLPGALGHLLSPLRGVRRAKVLVFSGCESHLATWSF
jgi:hypothetical protein